MFAPSRQLSSQQSTALPTSNPGLSASRLFDIVSKCPVLMLSSAKCSVRISFYANSLFTYAITSLPIPSWNLLCKEWQNPLGVTWFAFGWRSVFFWGMLLECSPAFGNESLDVNRNCPKDVPCSIAEAAMLMCNLSGAAVTDHMPVHECQEWCLKKAVCSLAFYVKIKNGSSAKNGSWRQLHWILK